VRWCRHSQRCTPDQLNGAIPAHATSLGICIKVAVVDVGGNLAVAGQSIGGIGEAATAHFANDFRDRKAYLCDPPIMMGTSKKAAIPKGIAALLIGIGQY